MDGGLMSSGADGELLSVEQILHPWELANLTTKTLNALFPEIPEDAVRHRHLVLFGMMESGKTSLMNFLAAEARRRYGDELNVIAAYSIRQAMDLINPQRVQLILVDDAIKEQNSRQSMRNADDVADFYRIRHLYEAVAKRGGVVVTVWATQRFKSLDTCFRQGHLLVFKTVAVDPLDDKLIRDFVGNRAHAKLAEITERIYIQADDDAKSECVVCIPIASGAKAGTFRYRYVQPFLRFIGSEDAQSPDESFLWNVGAALERYRKDRKWRKAANLYYRWSVDKVSQQTLASREGVAQSTVSDLIASMKGELSRAAGLKYEEWKARQLQQRGFSVDHRGGKGEPDIICTRPGTDERRVYSCKCLDFDRRTFVNSSELAPEVHEARATGAALILCVYNLADSTEQELPQNRDRLPKRIPVDVVR